MKDFTELCLSDNISEESTIAMYMDDQLSEENLIEDLGSNAATYGLIALNMHIANDICYELSYPILIAEKPTTQEQVDEIFERLGL